MAVSLCPPKMKTINVSGMLNNPLQHVWDFICCVYFAFVFLTLAKVINLA